ncbi:uncharacterized protein PHACADRAFT_246454, partial [Phanerochaete carnosa HHB-10118-sp]
MLVCVSYKQELTNWNRNERRAESKVQWPRGPAGAEDGEDDSVGHEVSEGVNRSRGS